MNFYAHLPKAGDEFLNNCLPEFRDFLLFSGLHIFFSHRAKQ